MTSKPNLKHIDLDSATVDQLRARYRQIRSRFADLNLSPVDFDARVRESNPSTPIAFVRAAMRVRETCRRCAGTGRFITYIENGTPKGPGGECFRCGGKGYQTIADIERNYGYDVYAPKTGLGAY